MILEQYLGINLIQRNYKVTILGWYPGTDTIVHDYVPAPSERNPENNSTRNNIILTKHTNNMTKLYDTKQYRNYII